MIKKGILIVLILLLNCCVGTIRVADKSEVDSTTSSPLPERIAKPKFFN